MNKKTWLIHGFCDETYGNLLASKRKRYPLLSWGEKFPYRGFNRECWSLFLVIEWVFGSTPVDFSLTNLRLWGAGGTIKVYFEYFLQHVNKFAYLAFRKVIKGIIEKLVKRNPTCPSPSYMWNRIWRSECRAQLHQHHQDLRQPTKLPLFLMPKHNDPFHSQPGIDIESSNLPSRQEVAYRKSLQKFQ